MNLYTITQILGIANDLNTCGTSGSARKLLMQAAALMLNELNEPTDGSTLFENVRRQYQIYGKIAAIRYYREKANKGLLESKQTVEEWAASHGWGTPTV